MRAYLTLTAGALLAAATLSAQPTSDTANDLDAPVKVTAGKLPLDVQRSGHSAPFLGDLDGDGLPDLLVGQFTEGKLRVYPNSGTRQSPRFDGYKWFKAGGDFGRVPVG